MSKMAALTPGLSLTLGVPIVQVEQRAPPPKPHGEAEQVRRRALRLAEGRSRPDDACGVQGAHQQGPRLAI